MLFWAKHIFFADPQGPSQRVLHAKLPLQGTLGRPGGAKRRARPKEFSNYRVSLPKKDALEAAEGERGRMGAAREEARRENAFKAVQQAIADGDVSDADEETDMIATECLIFYKVDTKSWDQQNLQAHVPAIDDPEVPACRRVQNQGVRIRDMKELDSPPDREADVCHSCRRARPEIADYLRTDPVDDPPEMEFCATRTVRICCCR